MGATLPTISRLALLCAGLTILEVGQAPENTLFWDALFNAGHALLFGVVFLLIKGLPWIRGPKQAFLVTLVIAAASELLQLADPTRDASVGDFLRDGAGALAFSLFLLSRAPSGSAKVRFANVNPLQLRLAALALLLSVAVPFLFVCGIYVERQRAFPTLFRLDGSWWERRLISTGMATLTTVPGTRDGIRALLVLRPGLYPGIVFDEPYPDWSAFRRLVLTVRSAADTPLTLTIRVHDASHDQRLEDRFNRRIAIAPGANRIVIPLDEIRYAPVGREMDLHRIRGIVLYIYQLDQPVCLYLGPLTLE